MSARHQILRNGPASRSVELHEAQAALSREWTLRLGKPLRGNADWHSLAANQSASWDKLKHGKNSTQYEQAGGTRTSERKSPVRRAAPVAT